MECFKCPVVPADTVHMIISDDQARLVAKTIRASGPPPQDAVNPDVEPGILEAARAAACSAPEVRSDRIEHARVWLNQGGLDSRLIAEKMMSRIMSDWLP